jgi:integrase
VWRAEEVIPPRRLLDALRQAVRMRHYSPRTEEAYVWRVKQFVVFHGKRHPSQLGAPEVEQFLSSLASVRRVSASTQNQALSAILFLYRDVLGCTLPWLSGLVRACRPARLPVVLSPDEAAAVLSGIPGVPRLMAVLLYGSGLRLLECARLRVKDVDFDRQQIAVHAGKGRTDRPFCRRPSSPTWRAISKAWPASTGRISRGAGLGGPAGGARPEVSERRPRVALAVGVSRDPAPRGPGDGPAPAAPPA